MSQSTIHPDLQNFKNYYITNKKIVTDKKKLFIKYLIGGAKKQHTLSVFHSKKALLPIAIIRFAIIKKIDSLNDITSANIHQKEIWYYTPSYSKDLHKEKLKSIDEAAILNITGASIKNILTMSGSEVIRLMKYISPSYYVADLPTNEAYIILADKKQHITKSNASFEDSQHKKDEVLDIQEKTTGGISGMGKRVLRKRKKPETEVVSDDDDDDDDDF